MRNSTFAMLCWVLRPEMSIRVNQDTIHCAALSAQKSTQAQLSAPRRNIGHLIHRRAAFLAVSWSHHRISTPRLAERFSRLAGRRRGAFIHSRRQLLAKAPVQPFLARASQSRARPALSKGPVAAGVRLRFSTRASHPGRGDGQRKPARSEGASLRRRRSRRLLQGEGLHPVDQPRELLGDHS